MRRSMLMLALFGLTAGCATEDSIDDAELRSEEYAFDEEDAYFEDLDEDRNEQEVTVRDNVDCDLLPVQQCSDYPDQCELAVEGCDNVPICEIGPFGEGICQGCDPFAYCTDKRPTPIFFP